MTGPKGKKLDAREKKFKAGYLLHLDPKRAAEDAGYSKSIAASKAYQWVSNGKVKPHLFDAIQEAMYKRAQRTQIDSDYVLSTIQETVERCRQAKPVLDRKGEPVLTQTPEGDSLVPAYAFDASGVFRGCELLGKHLALFTDKVDHSSKDGSMSPPDRIEIVALESEGK